AHPNSGQNGSSPASTVATQGSATHSDRPNESHLAGQGQTVSDGNNRHVVAGVVGQRPVEPLEGLGLRALLGLVHDAAVPQGVVDHQETTTAKTRCDLLQIVEVTTLVGIDEGGVELAFQLPDRLVSI